MRLGFTVARCANEMTIQISEPENNKQSALVTHFRVDDSFGLLMGHLYYRSERLAELAAVCPPDALRQCQGNDAALALAAYRYLGLTALQHLEGDFALLIWDVQTTTLIGLRDPLGGYPLFWIQQESIVAFSTSLRPLCSMLPQCSLNEAYLADFLMLQTALPEARSEQCVYLGIQRVLTATIVIARANPDRIERYPYWDWLKESKDPGTHDLVQIAQQYRARPQAAVGERLRGCTLAALSGGMDSTSVALLAQQLVSSGKAEAPLHTYSRVYDRLPLLARERPYIECALQQQTGIVPHRLLC